MSGGTLIVAMVNRDYCEELRDSLDLVPIGAWHGNGRKVGWYSPFLLAAWDPDPEEFQSVCRCMSGFSDAFYAQVCILFLCLTLINMVLDCKSTESPKCAVGLSCPMYLMCNMLPLSKQSVM